MLEEENKKQAEEVCNRFHNIAEQIEQWATTVHKLYLQYSRSNIKPNKQCFLLSLKLDDISLKMQNEAAELSILSSKLSAELSNGGDQFVITLYSYLSGVRAGCDFRFGFWEKAATLVRGTIRMLFDRKVRGAIFGSRIGELADMIEAQILRNFDAQKMEVVEIEKRIIVQSNIDNKNEVRK